MIILNDKKIIHIKNNNITRDWLLSNGFRYNRIFSDNDMDVYSYRFPVVKYNKFTILECEFRIILVENYLTIDVYDYGTNDKYAPFYYCEYGNFDTILNTIYNKIQKELKKLSVIIL